MSLSLVADYDSSSSDEASEKKSISNSVPLAPASEMLDPNTSNLSNSVFSNPYLEAENSHYAILEKHVKMTEVLIPKINQEKKICWKFNKGKCKHGDKCRFFHQTPLYVNNNSTENIDTKPDEVDNEIKKSKKRCGLKDDLVPPKKYMKVYNKTK